MVGDLQNISWLTLQFCRNWKIVVAFFDASSEYISMNALTPKKREIAEREARILDVARPLLLESGYHGLNMDRIATKLGLSKGTVYNLSLIHI